MNKSVELNLYSENQTLHVQLLMAEEENARLRNELERLKDFAAGRGMVSEAADMREVAVLVCGLHDEITRLRREQVDEVHQLREDLSLCAAGPWQKGDPPREGRYLIKYRTEYFVRVFICCSWLFLAIYISRLTDYTAYRPKLMLI